jgi:hypothetical protein
MSAVLQGEEIAQASTAAAVPVASAAECRVVFPTSSPICPQEAVDSITASELLAHVQYLSDDERAGREAGTPGGQASGEYIAAQLRELRVPAAGPDREYFQPFGKGYRNVLAMIEGSDPEAANEVIVVGAHYDHVGHGSRKTEGAAAEIRNGADDNASGVAAALEIAEAMSQLARVPRRSLLFAFWDAEEKGLLGSRHWVTNPTFPVERVAAVINLDMVGRLRDNTLIVWGTASAPGWRELIANHNTSLNLLIDFRPKVLTKSDHYSLFVKGIPALFPTTGIHPQLHRPDDDVKLIDADGMQRVTQLVQRIAYDMADRSDRLSFREAARNELETNPAKKEELPAPRPTDENCRFGISCRREESEPNARVVVAVAADTPAALAGLAPADRICAVGDIWVTESLDLGRILADAAGPVPVIVERNGQFLTLSLDAERGTRKVPDVLDSTGDPRAVKEGPPPQTDP